MFDDFECSSSITATCAVRLRLALREARRRLAISIYNNVYQIKQARRADRGEGRQIERDYAR